MGSGRHLAAGHALNCVDDEDNGDVFASCSGMNGFAHTDGSEVAVALVGEYDFAGIGTFNAGCNSRSSAVCGFDHINGEVIISHNGTANGSNTNGSAFNTEFINNAIYGMTGGQMAPTSLPGQVTQTSPYGRNTETQGFPIRVCELLSELDGPAYLERVTANNVKNVRNAKKAIKKAFQNQIDGKGFSLVEVLSSCPTNWGMTPQKALEWIDEKMIPYYPLGVYRDKDGENNG